MKKTRWLTSILAVVTLTLLKRHLNRYPVPDWVHQQAYLHPYP